jgi:putative transposase
MPIPVVVPFATSALEVLRRPLESAQYLSIRYTERLAAAGAVASVGSRGDSYDNALAESFIGLFKTELVRNRGPFRGQDDLEIATLEWVDWYNHRRLHGEIGMIPPAELEQRFADDQDHGPCGPVEADRPARLGGAPAGLEMTENQ